MENWKSVVGHEGSYEVSDLGCVRSVTKRTPYKESYRLRKGRVLRAFMHNTYGHLNVKLSTGARGGVETKLVHRLVIEAFIGPCPAGMQVRHLDGDPTNNSLGNLAYGTAQDNADDMLLHGTRLFGEKHHSLVLSDQDVVDLRDLYNLGVGPTQLAQEFMVSRNHVYDIVNGRRRAHV